MQNKPITQLDKLVDSTASIPSAGRYVNAKRAKTGLQRERIRATLAESETAKGMQNNGKGTGIASPVGSSGPAGGFYRCQRALPTGWQTAGLCTGGHGGPGTGHPLCAGYHLPGVFDEQAHHGLCGDEAMGGRQTGPGRPGGSLSAGVRGCRAYGPDNQAAALHDLRVWLQ